MFGKLTQRSVLTAFIALLSVSCTSSADPENRVAIDQEEQENVAIAIADKQSTERAVIKAETDYYGSNAQAEARTRSVEMIRDDTDGGTPPSLSATTNELIQGMAYVEARTLLINRGWIPHTQSTTGPEYNWNNPDVEDMQARGFDEIHDCVNSTCEAQFVYEDRLLENGSILAVSAEILGHIPIVADWSIEDNANKTYAQRNFNAALFSQLQAEASFCLNAAQCSLDRYILNDALLLSGTYGFGSTRISLIPTEPVSQVTALAYARALDTQRLIDFESSRFYEDINAEVYQEAGLPAQNVAETQGSVTQVKLLQTDSGKVSEIAFENIVL